LTAYNSDGTLNYTIDEEGNKTTYGYSTFSSIISTTGNSVLVKRLQTVNRDVSYTASIVSASGKSIAYTFNPANRNNANNASSFVAATTTYNYDTRGNITLIRNPRGVQDSFVYDGWNECIQETRADSIASGYTELSGITAVSGYFAAYDAITYTTYNSDGRVVTREYVDNGQTTECGDRVQEAFEYNNIGQVTAEKREVKVDTGGNPVWLTTRHFYDGAGRRVLTISPEGRGTYTDYDSQGRVLEVISGVTAEVISGVTVLTDLTTAQQNKIVNRTAALTYFSTTLLGSLLKTQYTYYDNATDASKGKLKEIKDTAGVTQATFVYDATYGYPIRVTNALNHYTRMKYDPYGRVTETMQYDYNSGTPILLAYVKTVYDLAGRKIQENKNLFIPTIYSPSPTPTLANGPLTKTIPEVTVTGLGAGDIPTTGTWVATRYEYDRAGRLTYVHQDDGSVSEVQYDGLSRTYKTIAYEGTVLAANILQETQNWYDKVGNLIETKRTDHATVASGTTDEVFRTTFFYDALNRLVTQVDNNASGSNVASATDFRYNSLGQTIAVADANGPLASNRTFQRRDGTGTNVLVNNFGNAAIMTYDGLGRLTKREQYLTTDGKGKGTTMGANLNASLNGGYTNDLSKDTSQAGDGLITEKREYFDDGMLKALVDDNGNRSSWVYDRNGQQTQEKKGERVAPSLADRDDPDTTIQWTYNTNGTLQKITKEDGTYLTYTYDTAKRVTRIAATNAPSTVVGTTDQTFSYDGASRQKQTTDNNNKYINEDDVTTQWIYDSLGRTVQERQRIGANASFKVITSGFTSTRRSALTYPSSNRTLSYVYHAGSGLASITDSDNINNPTVLAQFDYIGSRLLKRQYPTANGVNLDMTNGTGTNYDPRTQQPSNFKHVKSGTTVLGFAYTYDSVGNKLTQVDTPDTKDNQTFTQDSASRLKTTVRGSSPWADLASNLTWTIDGAGNWSTNSTTRNGSTTNEARTDTSFNEYVAIGGVSQTQDTNGNLTADGTYLYYWDAFNRLSVVYPANSQVGMGGQFKAIYVYDAQNRRVRKSVNTTFTGGGDPLLSAPASAPAGLSSEEEELPVSSVSTTGRKLDSVTASNTSALTHTPHITLYGDHTDYYYDGWRTIEEHLDAAQTMYSSEFDMKNNSTFISYWGASASNYFGNWWISVHGTGTYHYPTCTLKRQFVLGLYLDETLVMDVDTSSNGSIRDANDTRYFYHGNTLYSVVGLTNASGGLVEAYQYDPYGRHVLVKDGNDADTIVNFGTNDTRTPLGASAVGNPFTFTGQRFDPETGLLYYKNRYYSASQGRFISRDPLGYKGGINLYTYVEGNPAEFVDPLGLFKLRSLAECIARYKRLQEKVRQLDGYKNRYNKKLDDKGGCPNHYDQTPTKKGGHFEQIDTREKSLNKHIPRFFKECIDGDDDDNDRRKMFPLEPLWQVVRRPLPTSRLSLADRILLGIPGSDELWGNIGTGAIYVAGGAIIIAGGSVVVVGAGEMSFGEILALLARLGRAGRVAGQI
jgi:RHS repeat-associated protein